MNPIDSQLITQQGWELAEILKSTITNFKSIDNRLKSVNVIRPIKSMNHCRKPLPFEDQKAQSIPYPHYTIFVVACLKGTSFGIIIIIDITDLQLIIQRILIID